MPPNLLKNKKFNSIITEFQKKHKKELLDIILFGSSIKGKDNPADTDILLLFKDKESIDVSYELRKKLEGIGLKPEITTKKYESLFDPTFKAREAILGEGYSLTRKGFISEGFGYSSMIAIQYELKGASQVKRMQLQYALYGRDKKSGITKELKLKKFSNTVFLCPIENSEKAKEFFESWKIKFEMFPILIPQRMT